MVGVFSPKGLTEIDKYLLPKNSVSKKFSQIFKVLFQTDANLVTWLEVIETKYKADWKRMKITISEDELKPVKDLFDKLELNMTENEIVVNFTTFLYKIFLLLEDVGFDRDDNIFEFMKVFKIKDWKVVVVAEDPSPDCNSSGYAFHKSVCPSSKKLIKFLQEELLLISPHVVDAATGNNNFMGLDNLNDREKNCDLSGWIEQGVLLLNSRLTYSKGSSKNNKTIQKMWDHFTDFLVQELSRMSERAVFLLNGNVALKKKNVITNIHKHLLLHTYHPGFYLRRNLKISEGMDWTHLLPFLNINFFLYRCDKKIFERMVDWNHMMTNNNQEKDKRLKGLRDFFKNFRKIGDRICLSNGGELIALPLNTKQPILQIRYFPCVVEE